ncbi:hypothetical protein G9A89_020619 [Geosiphon pyriformis]|nr:hypothetical protein G9A89_020619 [Geosiphon pyriformis]
MVVKKIREVSENDCKTLNKISQILQHSIILLYKPPLPSEDNNRTIISGLLFVSIMRVLIIVDIWYSTAALGALETGSALKAVATSINEVTLNQTLANEITFSPYWKKELTDLQAIIMAQWDLLGTSLLMGHCLSKLTGNRIQIYLSLEKEM